MSTEPNDGEGFPATPHSQYVCWQLVALEQSELQVSRILCFQHSTRAGPGDRFRTIIMPHYDCTAVWKAIYMMSGSFYAWCCQRSQWKRESRALGHHTNWQPYVSSLPKLLLAVAGRMPVQPDLKWNWNFNMVVKYFHNFSTWVNLMEL